VQGKLAIYRVRRNSKPKDLPAQRGTVQIFSRASRFRLLKFFQRIDWENQSKPLFCTLTYPDQVNPTLKQRNIHRAVFARAIENHLGQEMPAIWRVEWMDRKTGDFVGHIYPHYHLLIFGVDYIPYEGINILWKKTIGVEGYVRTDIRRVSEHGPVIWYTAKYLSKEAAPHSLVMERISQQQIGRSYGYLRKSKIKLATKFQSEALDASQRAAVWSLAGECLPHVSGRQDTSFTLLGDHAEALKRIITGETLTDEVYGE
jgi:hypothetical protein